MVSGHHVTHRIIAKGSEDQRHTLVGLVDTDAQQSVISAQWVQEQPELVQLIQRLDKPRNLKSFNSVNLQVDQYIELEVVSKLLTVTQKFLLIPDLQPTVYIGWDLCQKFQWRVMDVPVHTPAQYRELETQFNSGEKAATLLDPTNRPGFR